MRNGAKICESRAERTGCSSLCSDAPSHTLVGLTISHSPASAIFIHSYALLRVFNVQRAGGHKFSISRALSKSPRSDPPNYFESPPIVASSSASEAEDGSSAAPPAEAEKNAFGAARAPADDATKPAAHATSLPSDPLVPPAPYSPHPSATSLCPTSFPTRSAPRHAHLRATARTSRHHHKERLTDDNHHARESSAEYPQGRHPPRRLICDVLHGRCLERASVRRRVIY
jgi:hypothetical protein